MSVRGEFQRILGDTTARLRVRGEHALAAALERADSSTGEALDARAGAVLDAVEAATREELEATLDHLREICRVVVGR
jgi:hypothetical protein